MLHTLLNHRSSSPNGCGTNEVAHTSPLHLAAFRGHSKAVLTLATMDPDVNLVDPKGRTPLDLAASQGHVDCVSTLINCGAQLDHSQPGTGLISVHRAAANGHSICLEKLLQT